MAQFDLTWDSDNVASNPNATGQTVSYRYKGDTTWITTGFTPPNPLGLAVGAVVSPILTDNRVIEFKVEALCTINGPTGNDNGIQEEINFVCIAVTTSGITHLQATATVSLLNTSITKVRFTLKKSSDNSVIVVPTIVVRTGDSAAITKTGLIPLTNYYWQIELYANVQAVEVKSSDTGYLGVACSPYPFTTSPDPVCDPLTAGSVSSIEA